MDKEELVKTYNGILLSHKKNEILLFAMTWLELEGTMLNKISQRKTNNRMRNLRNKTNEQRGTSTRLSEDFQQKFGR